MNIKKHREGLVALLLLLFSAMALYGICATPAPLDESLVGPMALPWLAVSGCIFCAFLLGVRWIFSLWAWHKGCIKPQKKTLQDLRPTLNTLLIFFIFSIYLAGMIGLEEYFLSMDNAPLPLGNGFILTSIIFLPCCMFFLGRRDYKNICLLSLISVGVLVGLFGYVFHIALP